MTSNHKPFSKIVSNVTAGGRKRGRFLIKDGGDFTDDFLAGLPLARFDHEKLVLSEELYSTEDKVVFIRPCYRKLEEILLPHLKDSSKCVVTGTPGIGKSMFGYYMLPRMLEEGISVIYIHFGWNHCHLYLPKNLNDRLKEVLESHKVPIPQEPGWAGRFVDNGASLTEEARHLYAALVKLRALVVVICDPPRNWGTEQFSNPPCGLLVVTSPTPDRTSSVGSHGNALTWYMPLWTPEEIRNLLRARNDSELTEKEETELKLREMRFGEIPRYIAQVRNSHEQMIEISGSETNKIIKGLSGPALAQIVNPISDAPQASGRIVHMEVTESTFKNYKKKFASEMLEREIVLHFHRTERHAWSSFASSVRDIPGFASMVGVRSEIWWHGTLQSGKKFSLQELFMKTTRLNSSYRKGDNREVNIVESGARYSAKQNLSDITSLSDFTGSETALYFNFLKGNVPAIDAIWVFDGVAGKPLFDPDTTSPPPPLYVCGVQMTLSGTHKMNATGMDTFMQLVKEKAPPRASVQLIFVTHSDLNKTFHYIQIEKYKNLRQWLITVPPERIFQ